jgi:hypothetical protein
VDDARALQPSHPVPQGFTHPSDLAIQPLFEHNLEGLPSRLLDFTWQGDGVQDGDTG